MKCSRRSFLGLLATGILSRARSSAAVEGLWTAYGDFDAWALSNREIVAVGSRLVILDSTSGQQLRTANLSPPPAPDRVLGVTATPTAIVFGWYGWKGEGRIVFADPQSLRIRWHRRIEWPDDERELSPGIFAVVRDNAIFVLLSGKRGENLLRLSPDTGETVWSAGVEAVSFGGVADAAGFAEATCLSLSCCRSCVTSPRRRSSSDCAFRSR